MDTHPDTEKTENTLPDRSKQIYEKQYEMFRQWLSNNEILLVNESVLLAYFQELSRNYSPNSLWSKYSFLKATINLNMNVDISNYKHLLLWLKEHSKGYIPKKARILTGDQVIKFVKEAPDFVYLLHKVILVMGVFGGLRRDEMVRLSVDDVRDEGDCLVVRVPSNNKNKSKGFTIVEEEEIGALKLVRKYMELRPSCFLPPRFFLAYKKGKCTTQPVGKNTVGAVSKAIAEYLGLENFNEYTGHCFRRTSSTLLVETENTFRWRNHTTIVTENIEKNISNIRSITKRVPDPENSIKSHEIKKLLQHRSEISFNEGNDVTYHNFHSMSTPEFNLLEPEDPLDNIKIEIEHSEQEVETYYS